MKMIDLLPFIEEAFAKGETFTIPITGTSMLPLLVEGRDRVTLIKPPCDDDGRACLDVGDLPLYRRRDGAFVLHRVVGIDKGTYIMCGDNQFVLERNIEPEQIIGVVCRIKRDEADFPVTDERYRKYVDKMCKNISYRYMRRRIRHTLSFIKKKLG